MQTFTDQKDLLEVLREAEASGRTKEAAAALRQIADHHTTEEALQFEAAKIAERLGLWLEAAACWAHYGVSRPDQWWARAHEADALFRAGLRAEADSVLLETQAAHPDDPGPFREHARLAERAANWTEAAARWARLLAVFPSTPEAALGLGRALQRCGRTEEALQILRDGAAQHPDRPGFAEELAILHETAGDWTEAEIWWREASQRYPNIWWHHAGIANALLRQGRPKDAAATLERLFSALPQEPHLFFAYARLAEQAKDWKAALARWRSVESRFPDMVEPWRGKAAALRALGRRREAAEVLGRALPRFPDDGGLRHEAETLAALDDRWARSYKARAPVTNQADDMQQADTGSTHTLSVIQDMARLAEQRRDWVTAARWWGVALREYPDIWWHLTGLARALGQQGAFAEAEAQLLAHPQHFDTQPAVAAEYANLADAAGLPDAASQRWDEAVNRFPDSWETHRGKARFLRDHGRMDEATALLEAAIDRFPGVTDVFCDLADIADRRQDWAAAERFWEKFNNADNRFWWSFANWCRAICRQGRPDDAMAAFDLAATTFRSDRDLWIVVARHFHDAGYHANTVRVLDSMVAAFPSMDPPDLLNIGLLYLDVNAWQSACAIADRLKNETVADSDLRQKIGSFCTLLQTRMAESAPDLLPGREVALPAVGDEALCLRFESLGGDGPGCEIGLVQRHYGAEPLGLLRWGSISVEDLIRALIAHFEGFGTWETTEVKITTSGDYKTIDTIYGTEMMTFVHSSKFAPQEMLRRSSRRLTFLKDKLLRDLKEGRKIFVYRAYADNLTDDTVARLQAAIASHGPSRLLYIRKAPTPEMIGAVRKISPGLCYGYVEGFSGQPNSKLFLGGWLAVFDIVAAIWPESTSTMTKE